ncbi:MAG: FAD-dependent oxidoreductase [Eubacterium sp.]|jgi:glutamate synthase (NADPH) small chain|nr:FAD-dependent oxidoreductase [Eubacterium sp.]MBP7427617.1 FAD-dependent oxidoreductase [Lachnospira sp.]MBP8713552.1 FAD-dependent oxidoreductase [Lachnospira sp.]MBS5269425.1 FAD-dependent oxidoreductase [Eubacterium sp.]
MESLYQDLERRIVASPPGLCPVDLTRSFIKMCLAQSCGKCVPCRVGLRQLARLFDNVLDGEANEETVENIKLTAEGIYYSADCAIGYEAAKLALKSVDGCIDDFESHIHNGFCSCNSNQPVACVKSCPAGVDIPGYIALVQQGRYADAVRLIRRDNPMPTTCAYICEHPCENRCKRTIIDAPVNIRGLKKMAVDNSGIVPVPECEAPTGKKVAIIGGGPGGLSAAYYLALMGHKVTIFEQRKQLGGMLRYGIPNYRFPRKKLDEEIDSILSTGIEVKKNISVGKDISFDDITKEYDATYISIGAHADKKIGIEGEDAKSGITSAVEMLRAIGDGDMPDYTGKKVIVIGGGNVAMDVARSSIRLGASKVSIVYRRRKADMTALEEEVEGAEAEGCDVLELMSPVRIKQDEEGNAIGLIVKPQMISRVSHGRPAPKAAAKDEVLLESDLIVVAIGQGIETKSFEEHGIKVQRGVISALNTGNITPQDGEMSEGVFAGGDCVTGPATVIKAIAAGKVAAANIDEYLGFNHEITCDVEIPYASNEDKVACGRVEVALRDAAERKNDFEPIEYGFSCEEACQEAGRCLRCDHFGFGAFRGGREEQW